VNGRGGERYSDGQVKGKRNAGKSLSTLLPVLKLPQKGCRGRCKEDEQGPATVANTDVVNELPRVIGQGGAGL